MSMSRKPWLINPTVGCTWPTCHDDCMTIIRYVLRVSCCTSYSVLFSNNKVLIVVDDDDDVNDSVKRLLKKEQSLTQPPPKVRSLYGIVHIPYPLLK